MLCRTCANHPDRSCIKDTSSQASSTTLTSKRSAAALAAESEPDDVSTAVTFLLPWSCFLTVSFLFVPLVVCFNGMSGYDRMYRPYLRWIFVTFVAVMPMKRSFSFAKIASLDGLPLTKKTVKLVVREASTQNYSALDLRIPFVLAFAEYPREIGIALNAHQQQNFRFGCQTTRWLQNFI